MKLHNRIKLWMVEKYRVLHGCPRDIDEERFDAGFSLLESLVSIVVFALVITAVGSSLVMAHRINARSEVLMQEQLKVSRAVEGIMASGVDPRILDDYPEFYHAELCEYIETEEQYDPILQISQGTLENGGGKAAFYEITVKSVILGDTVSVTTYVRSVKDDERFSKLPNATENGNGGGDEG